MAETLSDSPAEDEADKDSFLIELAAFDEALRNGRLPAGDPGDCATPPAEGMVEVDPHECVRLLTRAWPRTAQSSASEVFPRQIGRFEIRRQLGRGGFGVVYLAIDPRLGRPVALKVPHPHVQWNRRLLERFLLEGRAVATLDHPQIVPVFETGESGTTCYIVSSYCEGPTLAAWLKAQVGPVPVGVAAMIVQGLADALEHSHSRGILHRDLKPANILLAPRQDQPIPRSAGELPFVPRVTDFGLAKLCNDEAGDTETSVLLGTPLYAAPEQVGVTKHEIGPSTDVYSLGVVLFELLIGRPPFQGESFVDVVDLIRRSDPVPPRRLRRDVPHDLETVCLKCLEKEPQRRYPSAGALRDDLGHFLAGRPTHARPLGGAARALRWFRRNPERAGLVATIALAVLAVVAVSTWFAARLDVADRVARFNEERVTVSRILARRRMGTSGWQRENLADIKKIAPNATDDGARLGLRNEAIEALCSATLERKEILLEAFDGYGVAYSPDGRFLAVGHNIDLHEVGVIALFDASTGAELPRLTFEPSLVRQTREKRKDRIEGVRSLLFSADGRRLFAGTRTGMIHVWDVESWTLARESWPGHQSYVIGLSQLPGLNVLASVSGGSDPKLCLWDLETGEFLDAAPLPGNLSETLAAIDDRLYLVAEKSVREFRVDRITRRLTEGWTAPGTMVTANSDGKTLIVDMGSELAALDVRDGQVLRKWKEPHRKRIHEGALHSLAVSPDGRWLLSAASDGAKLWDLGSSVRVERISKAMNGRCSAAFHPSSRELAITREDRIEIWRIGQDDVWSASFNQSWPIANIISARDGEPRGVIFAEPDASGNDRDRVAIAASSSGALTTLPGFDGLHPDRFAMSNDGRTMVVEMRGELKVLPIEPKGPSGMEVILAATRESALPRYSPGGARMWYAGMAPAVVDEEGAQDVGFIAAVRVEDSMELFRWVNERSNQELHRSEILSLDVGDRFAAASSIDLILRVFNATNGQLKHEIPYPDGIVDQVCLADGERLVLGGTRSGRLVGVDTSTGVLQFDVAVHQDAISSITAADTGLIATGSLDRSLVVWRFIKNGRQELFRIGPLQSAIEKVHLNRDGTRLSVLLENETCIRQLDLFVLRENLRSMGLDW